MMPKNINIEQKFNELYPQIQEIVNRRKSSWTLSTLPWEDVESILITRIWQQLSLYDESRPFENWANRLISNVLSSLLRDNIYKFSRPCIASSAYGGLCAFNDGGDMCAFTPSHKQCNECPLYAKWEKKKQNQYHLNSSLPLHDTEIKNIESEFVDYDTAKKYIDKRMLSLLNIHDAKVYKLLYIDNLSLEQISIEMKYKIQENSAVGQVLRKLIIKFKKMVTEIIYNEDIV